MSGSIVWGKSASFVVKKSAGDQGSESVCQAKSQDEGSCWRITRQRTRRTERQMIEEQLSPLIRTFFCETTIALR